IVQKTHAENHGTAPIEIPADSAVVEEVVAQGFRIQIFATSSIDEANSAKLTAEGRVGQDEVYVVYDPPVYKVRVGDYVERLEANQRLSKLINQGYPDAWVVADRVIQRKITRIPKE
ncbi:MAG: SPOR domain-containing protein, partial [Ignavibacteriales bacterium]|nr:SPOR domain-containing protein [Ignavibacteriales bacterium]